MLVEISCFLLVIAFVAFSAYCAACETAITAYSKPKILTMAKDGNEKAKIVLSLQKEIDLVISSILTVNTIVNSLAVSFANVVCINIFGDLAIFYCPLIISVFIVLFAEVLPKMFTIADPEGVLFLSVYFIKYTYMITKPLNGIIGFIAKKLVLIVRKQQPQSDNQAAHAASLEELRGAIDLHVGSDKNIKQEKEMLKGILDLGSVHVNNIMVHRKNVFMVCADDEIDVILEHVVNCPYTRIPLWSENQDNIIGILHAKSLLRAVRSKPLAKIDVASIALKPWFIPENKDLLDQLQDFRLKHEHFAIVVDEYGSFIGILTLEDIIEEIVGEIIDEHDIDMSTGIRRQDDGSYVVRGPVNLRDVNREIGSKFKGNNVVTLAGLVINSLGVIPEVGHVCELFGYRFEVLRRSKNQITLLRLRKLENDDEEES